MFSNSTRIQHRIMVASELLASLETITNMEEAIQYFLPIFHKVAADTDPSVREILANDIGGIILYFFKHAPPALLSTQQQSPSSSSSSSSSSPSSPLPNPSSPSLLSPPSSESSTVSTTSERTSSRYCTSKSTIPSQLFSFTLIELLLDQNTTVSSPSQHGVVAIAEYLVSTASFNGNKQPLLLLDQEIVQGVIMKLYSLVEGKERRNMQQRTFIPTNSIGVASSEDTSYIDHGELHLSKMACLSLISALAQFLGRECCTVDCLPIIEKLAKDGLFYVRKEAVLAVGTIVDCVDPTVAANRLIPLYHYFVGDPTWHVRNACIMMLPALCDVLPYEEKCQLAITSVNVFMNDSSPTVRFTLAEVTGEVITKFLPPDWETTGQPGKVPESIVNFFLSLGDNTHHQPTTQHPIENDCTLVCAHNFPAVLLTAGAMYWDSLFREKYMRLAKDHQVKARSSFAHSLHVIARIIGPARTVSDLVHIFALYLMDVDQVKSGVMEHLASFLEAMDAEDRCEYLPVLMEIWEGVATSRPFRETLVCQLIHITPLCTLNQFVEHLLPLVLRACQDEVAIIRDTGAQVFSAALELFKKDVNESTSSIIQLVNGLHLLVESPGYRQRLLFANIGNSLLLNGLSFHGFITYLLDLLLCLTNDKVVNVRIAASRCVATLFCEVSTCRIRSQQQLVLHHQKLMTAVQQLCLDQDIDVRLHMDVVAKQITSMTSRPSSSVQYHHHYQQQQQQQHQMEDLLTELPSPPCSPNAVKNPPTPLSI
ncbi:unnamed protein product [Absidia cylindrospora]